MSHEPDVAAECEECGSAIHMGRDVIRVQQGVMGSRGVVPLVDEMLFCSEECLKRSYAPEPAVTMRRRLP